jgi:CBS domain-containing protein
MERRHVGSVIVIDEVGEVAGIVTDRDIVLRVSPWAVPQPRRSTP